MKTMKKMLCFVALSIVMLILTSCIAAKPKEFTKEGVTVTLDTSFKEQLTQENPQFQMVYISSKYGFSGNGEKKADLSGIQTLKGYMTAVKSNSKKEFDTQEYKENDELCFIYGYLEQVVSSNNFTYMVIVKEGEEKFYVFNIWCLTSKFNDKAKEKMMNIAKSIKVE